jgi:hypothetical protein
MDSATALKKAQAIVGTIKGWTREEYVPWIANFLQGDPWVVNIAKSTHIPGCSSDFITTEAAHAFWFAVPYMYVEKPDFSKIYSVIPQVGSGRTYFLTDSSHHEQFIKDLVTKWHLYSTHFLDLVIACVFMLWWTQIQQYQVPADYWKHWSPLQVRTTYAALGKNASLAPVFPPPETTDPEAETNVVLPRLKLECQDGYGNVRSRSELSYHFFAETWSSTLTFGKRWDSPDDFYKAYLTPVPTVMTVAEQEAVWSYYTVHKQVITIPMYINMVSQATEPAAPTVNWSSSQNSSALSNYTVLAEHAYSYYNESIKNSSVPKPLPSTPDDYAMTAALWSVNTTTCGFQAGPARNAFAKTGDSALLQTFAGNSTDFNKWVEEFGTFHTALSQVLPLTNSTWNNTQAAAGRGFITENPEKETAPLPSRSVQASAELYRTTWGDILNAVFGEVGGWNELIEGAMPSLAAVASFTQAAFPFLFQLGGFNLHLDRMLSFDYSFTKPASNTNKTEPEQLRDFYFNGTGEGAVNGTIPYMYTSLPKDVGPDEAGRVSFWFAKVWELLQQYQDYLLIPGNASSTVVPALALEFSKKPINTASEVELLKKIKRSMGTAIDNGQIPVTNTYIYAQAFSYWTAFGPPNLQTLDAKTPVEFAEAFLAKYPDSSQRPALAGNYWSKYTLEVKVDPTHEPTYIEGIMYGMFLISMGVETKLFVVDPRTGQTSESFPIDLLLELTSDHPTKSYKELLRMAPSVHALLNDYHIEYHPKNAHRETTGEVRQEFVTLSGLKAMLPVLSESEEWRYELLNVGVLFVASFLMYEFLSDRIAF